MGHARLSQESPVHLSLWGAFLTHFASEETEVQGDCVVLKETQLENRKSKSQIYSWLYANGLFMTFPTHPIPTRGC